MGGGFLAKTGEEEKATEQASGHKSMKTGSLETLLVSTVCLWASASATSSASFFRRRPSLYCHLDLKYRNPNVNTNISWANKYSRRRPEIRTTAPNTAKKEWTIKNWIVSMCQTHEKILINLKVKLYHAWQSKTTSGQQHQSRVWCRLHGEQCGHLGLWQKPSV